MGCLKLLYQEREEGLEQSVVFLGKGYKKRATASKFCTSYYPFGLNHNTSWTRVGRENKYKYNAGSEENEITKNYEMYFRDYDPAIGRMMGIDPYAELYRGVNPYHYAANNPIRFNDPSGGLLIDMINDMFEMSSDGEEWSNAGGGGFTSDRGNSVNAGNYGWNGSDWGSGSSVNNPHTSNGRYYWKRNRFGNVSYKWKPGKVKESNSLKTNLSDAVSNVFDSDAFTSIYNDHLDYNNEYFSGENFGFDRVNLASEKAGELIAHNLKHVWEIYKKQGYAGNIKGDDVIDPETMDFFAKHGNWGGKRSQTKPYEIAGQKVYVNFIYIANESKPFGGAIGKINTPGVRNGEYIGGDLGAQVRFEWGDVGFSINISESKMLDTKGKVFNEALEFMTSLKAYILGRETGLIFANPYPY